MDDFTVHGDTFEAARDNLEKVLKRCIDTDLSLRHEKCHMLMTEGIFLGHLISSKGIQVDPKKIQIIQDLPTPGVSWVMLDTIGDLFRTLVRLPFLCFLSWLKMLSSLGPLCVRKHLKLLRTNL